MLSRIRLVTILIQTATGTVNVPLATISHTNIYVISVKEIRKCVTLVLVGGQRASGESDTRRLSAIG
jgi:hypothetical protein